MLDSWIIDEIRKRENNRRKDASIDNRPQLDLPLQEPEWEQVQESDKEEPSDRGVTIVQL